MDAKKKEISEAFYRYLSRQLIVTVILLVLWLGLKLLSPNSYRQVCQWYRQSFDAPTSLSQVIDSRSASQRQGGINESAPVSSEETSSAARQTVPQESTESTDPAPSSSETAGASSIPNASGVSVSKTAMVKAAAAGGANTAVSPVKGRITSYFSSREHPISGKQSFHHGVDIGANTGDPIVAVLSGTVCVSRYDATYGNYVVIEHSNGVKTLYAHCSKRLVEAGDRVTRGQTIAKVGSTGDSTGPHLHFELLVNGVRIDPFSVFKNLGC